MSQNMSSRKATRTNTISSLVVIFVIMNLIKIPNIPMIRTSRDFFSCHGKSHRKVKEEERN
jgi:hypothetical protein